MSALNTLVIVGVVAALGYFAYTQCWFNICQGELDLSPEEFEEILPGLFQGGPPISKQDMNSVAKHIQSGNMTNAQHNALPTIGTTKTSNYRTTWRTTEPMSQRIARVNAQAAAVPAGVKTWAAGASAGLASYCKDPKNATTVACKALKLRSGYAVPVSRSLFAETVLGGRLSN